MKPYRGLPKDGKMVYGWYIEIDGLSFIEFQAKETNNRCTIEVIPESVAQQIGLKDKHQNEIYEGDRVEITHWFVPCSDMYPERWLTNSPIVVELPEFYQYILNDNERDIDKENIYEIIPPEEEKSK